MLGMSTGPLFNIILLLQFENEWTESMLTVLISAGIGIGFLAIIPLYLVGEKYSLGEIQ